MNFALVTICVVLTSMVSFSVSKDAKLDTVSKHGHLSVSGVNLIDEHGQKVQLKGMSLFWDVWMPQYYNRESVHGIHDLCHSNVVRAAVAAITDYDGGYMVNPDASLRRLYAVIDAAIEKDIYVIVDWHDHEADAHVAHAVRFFDEVSKKYKGVPNVIYETFNEPTSQSWNNILKPYHEVLIGTIRANDPNSIIILGTPTWSQAVDQAAANPITGQKNIMYTLHYYAATHTHGLRNSAANALSRGLPLFVTEYGTVSANGDYPLNVEQSHLWWNWLNENNISYVNWAISDKNEGASAFTPGTSASQVCREERLSQSGKLVVAQNKA